MSEVTKAIATRFREMLSMDPGSSLSVLRIAFLKWADQLEAEQPTAVHTVQLVYTSPTGYSEDRYNVVAAFSSEERARLFVSWANRESKNIGDAYLKLIKSMDPTAALKKLRIPHPLNQIFPEDDWGARRHHFQYDDEYDMDPMFG